MIDELTKKESRELTQDKEFVPTPAMRVWLDTAVKLMTDNITEIETESKITAQSWYGWLKNDQFRLWYRAEWDKRLAMVGPTLDAIGLKNAKRDHKYWQDMQKRVGNLQDNPGKGVYIQQNFTEHAKNDLKEFE